MMLSIAVILLVTYIGWDDR